MLTSRLLLAALAASLSLLLPTSLAQTAVPAGSDPTPPEIPGSVTDRSGYSPSASQLSQLNSITNFVIVPFGAQSFDSIMGTFVGANGLNSCMAAGTCATQKDINGNAYTTLPGFTDSTSKVTIANGVLPNQPYDVMDKLNVTLSTVIGNPSHSFFQQKFKYNAGAMDGFVAYGGTLGALSMAYYNLSKYAPNNGIFALAKNYTLFDRFHAASFGDSVQQHLYFIGGTTVPFDPTTPGQCPANIVSQYSSTLFPQTVQNGSRYIMSNWNQQPPLNRQCYFIGELNSQNLCSGNPPFLPEIPNDAQTNPQQIGDIFDRYSMPWAWYAEDFVAAEAADCTQPGPRQFNVHDQPWQHYQSFALNNSAYWSTHQKDSTQFWTALASQTLEPLTWYVPSQVEDFGWSNNSPAAGNAFVDAFVANITNSALWKAGKLAVIYTWVGPSGLQDHVAPYKGDTYGPGGRVATIVMSPYHTSALKAINSDPYEHYSIYKMVVRRFGMNSTLLQQIWGNARYQAAADLTMSFPGGDSPGNGASAVSAASVVLVAVVMSVMALWL